jgi:hypothetical protein
MNASQKARIESLTRKLGIGSRADQGIKHVIGKMPINMSASRAEQVIAALEAEYEPIRQQQRADAMREACEADIWGGF